MKLTDILPYILWISTALTFLWFLVTCLGAYFHSKDKLAQLKDKINSYQTGRVTYFPIKKRLIYFMISFILLCFVNKWIILS